MLFFMFKGEFIVGNARALFLDEISTGLDAAATFDITSALRRWTRLMNGSAVVALLQPAPEVYDMFDDIILLREVSCVILHLAYLIEIDVDSCM